ncbi:hypothetical protein BGZ73_005682 [Actinomortierella ambigua]|nr:hypothetical protein BGZ73_005682 [Actinomortierella ambigua]
MTAAMEDTYHHLSTSVDAGHVQGTVLGPAEFPSPKDLSARTRVILSGGQFSAMINKDGKFSFEVPDGAYLLEVRSPEYIYPSVHITVSGKASTANLVPYGSDWSNTENRLSTPLVLTPRGATDYFVPREGFKITHLFANPMMLMMGFSVIMLFVMPKMMANMDPQAMEEMQDFQAPSFEMPDISASLAKLSAGSSSPKKRA